MISVFDIGLVEVAIWVLPEQRSINAASELEDLIEVWIRPSVNIWYSSDSVWIRGVASGGAIMLIVSICEFEQEMRVMMVTVMMSAMTNVLAFSDITITLGFKKKILYLFLQFPMVLLRQLRNKTISLFSPVICLSTC